MHFLLQLNSRFWLPLSILILAAITLTSLYPADQLPKVPGSDKTHHLVAYCLLMLPAALQRPKRWGWIALFFIAWSGLIELVQPYVNRYGEWLDLAANSAGVMLAILMAAAVHYFSAKTPE